jgi:hypothetical protein
MTIKGATIVASGRGWRLLTRWVAGQERRVCNEPGWQPTWIFHYFVVTE